MDLRRFQPPGWFLALQAEPEVDASFGGGLDASEGAAGRGPHLHYPGNRPSTLIMFERLDPETLGKVVALYEHKVYVQGVVWDVNSFDQWGVQLGKKLASQLTGAVGPASRAAADPVPIRGPLRALRSLRGE